MDGPILIHLNGAPGVGKLTIARSLAERGGARLLDNHATHNVAFALTEFRSPEFYDTVRAVRAVAYDRARQLPATIPVILTDAFFDDSAWGRESWAAMLDLAAARAARLFTIALMCEPQEHRRRIIGEDRAAKGKVRDIAYVDTASERRLLERPGDDSLRLDITHLAADAAASRIATWMTSRLT
jgi:predicted kinase